jgi:hypothetical protein
MDNVIALTSGKNKKRIEPDVKLLSSIDRFVVFRTRTLRMQLRDLSRRFVAVDTVIARAR